jgi:hypothetical protein
MNIMTMHDTLSTPAYWSNATPREVPGFYHAAGVPDDLEDQVSLLMACAQHNAYTDRLATGESLADAPNKVPLNMRDSPWVLGITIDRISDGKVRYPNGLLMGRQTLLTPADFNEQADALAEDPVGVHLPAASLAATTHNETGPRTISRETIYCLGRTVWGTMSDSKINGTPSMLGLPGERLGKPKATWRDVTTHIPIDTTVGAAYTNPSGKKKQVVAEATLIIPRRVPEQPRGHKRTVISLAPSSTGALTQTC